jgi:signal transduction histidine kinase
LAQSVVSALEARRSYVDLEMWIEAAPGQEGPLEEACFNFAYEPICQDGDVIGMLIVANDVTELVRARAHGQELIAATQRAQRAGEAANMAMDQFLATISHELRTPLNAILGFARLMRSNELAAEKWPKAIEAIERNATTQAQLIDDLLDISEIASGKLRLRSAHIDLTHVVAAALESVRPVAKAKDIRLTSRIEAGTYSLLADPGRLQQMLWHLLTNAVKFTPCEGAVSLLVRRDGDAAEVSVADSGEGIDPSFLPHVFERFRQADARSTRSHNGLGLGLTIVKALVEVHGGTIKADSAGKDRGAIFTVRLPLTRLASDASVCTRPLGSNEDALQGVPILVVDDDPDARELLATILEGAGAHAWSAGSVSEAIACVAAHRVALIVTDLAMPGEDGFALGRLYGKRSGNRPAPVIAVTAYARSTERARARCGLASRHTSPSQWIPTSFSPWRAR